MFPLKPTTLARDIMGYLGHNKISDDADLAVAKADQGSISKETGEVLQIRVACVLWEAFGEENIPT
jgi:hypothetical protein